MNAHAPLAREFSRLPLAVMLSVRAQPLVLPVGYVAALILNSAHDLPQARRLLDTPFSGAHATRLLH